jgi:hypothetical protein
MSRHTTYEDQPNSGTILADTIKFVKGYLNFDKKKPPDCSDGDTTVSCVKHAVNTMDDWGFGLHNGTDDRRPKTQLLIA